MKMKTIHQYWNAKSKSVLDIRHDIHILPLGWTLSAGSVSYHISVRICKWALQKAWLQAHNPVTAGWRRRGRRSSQARVRVSSAPGWAAWTGAPGGRVVVEQAPVSAVGAEPDLKRLLNGAPLFALDGREDVPEFPWKVWWRALARSVRVPSGFQSYWGFECVLFAPVELKELSSAVALAAAWAGWG